MLFAAQCYRKGSFRSVLGVMGSLCRGCLSITIMFVVVVLVVGGCVVVAVLLSTYCCSYIVLLSLLLCCYLVIVLRAVVKYSWNKWGLVVVLEVGRRLGGEIAVVRRSPTGKSSFEFVLVPCVRARRSCVGQREGFTLLWLGVRQHKCLPPVRLSSGCPRCPAGGPRCPDHLVPRV